MIRLSSLLTDAGTASLFGKKVIVFKGAEYPLLFMRAWASSYACRLGVSLSHQRMNTENQEALFAGLQTSFLGEHSCFLLGSFDELSKSKQQKWFSFLSHYHGPHTLIFFSSASFDTHSAMIELPDRINASLFQQITELVQKKPVSFRTYLFRYVETLSLDEAYVLVQYDAVLGKRSAQFAREWLPILIMPELSLFSLSQAFFDRNTSSFFSRWKQLASRYAAPFWITFWSEQLWRAYCYVRFQKMGKQLEAKKIGYRLPFSFLNRTWRNYSLEQLQAHHAFLYDIDYQLKNGGSLYVLDLFYASFFYNT